LIAKKDRRNPIKHDKRYESRLNAAQKIQEDAPRSECCIWIKQKHAVNECKMKKQRTKKNQKNQKIKKKEKT